MSILERAFCSLVHVLHAFLVDSLILDYSSAVLFLFLHSLSGFFVESFIILFDPLLSSVMVRDPYFVIEWVVMRVLFSVFQVELRSSIIKLDLLNGTTHGSLV